MKRVLCIALIAMAMTLAMGLNNFANSQENSGKIHITTSNLKFDCEIRLSDQMINGYYPTGKKIKSEFARRDSVYIYVIIHNIFMEYSLPCKQETIVYNSKQYIIMRSTIYTIERPPQDVYILNNSITTQDLAPGVYEVRSKINGQVIKKKKFIIR